MPIKYYAFLADIRRVVPSTTELGYENGTYYVQCNGATYVTKEIVVLDDPLECIAWLKGG